MPPRPNPTARQGRLGAELRKLREAAGVTAREAANLLGASQTQISHVESGRFGISEERLRRLAAHYDCDDQRLTDALVAMATERNQGWWEEFRGVLGPRSLDLSELEFHAVGLRTFQVIHIPGLLQTEEHVRAAIRYANPDLSQGDVESSVAHRLRRRQIIEGDRATPFDAVIHEAALRIKVGGARTARAQLSHILDTSDRDNVTVRVIPFAVDDFAGSGYSMLYAQGPVQQLDTVQLDTAHGSIFLDAEPQLRKYRRALSRIEEAALGAPESRDLIRRIAKSD